MDYRKFAIDNARAEFHATPKRLPKTIVPKDKSVRMLAIEREAAGSFAEWYPELVVKPEIEQARREVMAARNAAYARKDAAEVSRLTAILATFPIKGSDGHYKVSL